MKKLILFIVCTFVLTQTQFIAFSQTDEEKNVPERLKYLREKYEENFEANFQTVFDACKTFIEKEVSCQILSQKVREMEDGKSRGVIRSELCIFAQNDETVFPKIQKYALDPPFIRGGVWTSGRMKYVFIVTEVEANNINVELRGELSGFEDNASFKAHFFNSNGLLEFQAFEAIREMINNANK